MADKKIPKYEISAKTPREIDKILEKAPKIDDSDINALKKERIRLEKSRRRLVEERKAWEDLLQCSLLIPIFSYIGGC